MLLLILQVLEQKTRPIIIIIIIEYNTVAYDHYSSINATHDQNHQIH